MKRKQAHTTCLINAYSCPKNIIPRSLSSSPPEFYYYVARVLQLELQMSCELLLFTKKMFILFCTAMPQRSETFFFCIAHAFGKDFAHFLDACLD